jgi:hypothetical protein
MDHGTFALNLAEPPSCRPSTMRRCRSNNDGQTTRLVTPVSSSSVMN